MPNQATQSAAPATMDADRDKYRSFLATINGREYKLWKLPQNTVYRWRRGELPDVFEHLVANPELLLALYEDAVRKKLRGETPPGE
jgi:hypothetical protein